MASILVYSGILLTVLGIFGFIYCIWKANKIRSLNHNETSDAETSNQALNRLVAVNMSAMAIACIGLVMLMFGLII